MQFGRELRRADLAEYTQCHGNEVGAGVREIDSDPIGGHHEQFRFLVEELGETEVADSLLDESVAGHQREALHLPEVGLLTRHVDEEQLGDVAGAGVLFVFLGEQMGTAKDSRMTAIYFWYSARYYACVRVRRMHVMNSWSLLIIRFIYRYDCPSSHSTHFEVSYLISILFGGRKMPFCFPRVRSWGSGFFMGWGWGWTILGWELVVREPNGWVIPQWTRWVGLAQIVYDSRTIKKWRDNILSAMRIGWWSPIGRNDGHILDINDQILPHFDLLVGDIGFHVNNFLQVVAHNLMVVPHHPLHFLEELKVKECVVVSHGVEFFGFPWEHDVDGNCFVGFAGDLL
jgi:hypothetical protein